jgi:hypothetical protein
VIAAFVALHELAHCRAGDKGEDSILALIPYVDADFPGLCKQLTEETIGQHFSMADLAAVRIVRLPALPALVIELRGRLSGGVTRSLGVDAHGKTLSSHLLDLKISWPGHGEGD